MILLRVFPGIMPETKGFQCSSFLDPVHGRCPSAYHWESTIQLSPKPFQRILKDPKESWVTAITTIICNMKVRMYTWLCGRSSIYPLLERIFVSHFPLPPSIETNILLLLSPFDRNHLGNLCVCCALTIWEWQFIIINAVNILHRTYSSPCLQQIVRLCENVSF